MMSCLHEASVVVSLALLLLGCEYLDVCRLQLAVLVMLGLETCGSLHDKGDCLYEGNDLYGIGDCPCIGNCHCHIGCSL